MYKKVSVYSEDDLMQDLEVDEYLLKRKDVQGK
jgi:hypothetical protein